jgi:hypothetical protein
MKVFQPFDESLRKFFKEKENQIEKLLFVELNHDGSCERYIRSECGLTTDKRNEKIDHLRKFSLYPFMIEEIEEKIK